MSEFSESKFLAELRSVVDEIGGKLSITLNNDDMSYIVNYSRGGIPFKISLEALEAVCSTNGPGSLWEILMGATSPETMLNDQQNALICDLMNVSDVISKHTETKQERVEKLITKDDIHIVSTPIKPRTRKVRLGFQWVDEDGNVIRDIPPTPPCKQYLVIHPDRRFCHGVDVEEMLKGGLEYERVR